MGGWNERAATKRARRGGCGAQYRPPFPRALATAVTRVAFEIGAAGPARGVSPEDFADYFILRARLHGVPNGYRTMSRLDSNTLEAWARFHANARTENIVRSAYGIASRRAPNWNRRV